MARPPAQPPRRGRSGWMSARRRNNSPPAGPPQGHAGQGHAGQGHAGQGHAEQGPLPPSWAQPPPVPQGRPPAAQQRPAPPPPPRSQQAPLPPSWTPRPPAQPTQQPAQPTQQPGPPQRGPWPPTRQYPWHSDPDFDPARINEVGPRPPAQPPTGGPLPPGGLPGVPPPGVPTKLTVTRVAAIRSRQITEQGIRAFRRAATADGADRSGLAALTYATMMTYAADAAIAVSLANTLFFSAATAESKSKVALYLLITVAPFALVAPVIGPLLDRMQRGRRMALAFSFAGRAVLAIVMAYHFDDWGLYPAALGVLVLSKSFMVLKAAVTPRVLPPQITLVTTNSRLTAFGLVAGAVFGALAAACAFIFGSPGALVFTALLCVAGTVLCLRIPAWVESTVSEVPVAMRTEMHAEMPTEVINTRKRPLTQHVVVQLWGNASIRLLTGFLTLFVAFVVKAQTENQAGTQLALLGVVGAAAGIGTFGGNAIGARQQFAHSDSVILACVGASVAAAVLAAVVPGIPTAAIVALVSGATSALAKVCLDAVIQRDLPEESAASAFGRSETVLQLAWVFGGALGVLLPPIYWVGFTVVAVLVALGGVQTALLGRGRSLIPSRSSAQQAR